MNKQLHSLFHPRKVMMVMLMGSCAAGLGNCTTEFPDGITPVEPLVAADFDGRWMIQNALLTIAGGEITSFTFRGDGREGELLPQPIPLDVDVDWGRRSHTFFVLDTTISPLLDWPGVNLTYQCDFYSDNDSTLDSLLDGLSSGSVDVVRDLTFPDWLRVPARESDPNRYTWAYVGDETRTFPENPESDALAGESIMRRFRPDQCCVDGVCEQGILLEQDCVAQGGVWVFDCSYEDCATPQTGITEDGGPAGRSLDGRWDLTNEDGFGETTSILAFTIEGGEIVSLDDFGWANGGQLNPPIPVERRGINWWDPVRFEVEAVKEGVLTRITFDGSRFPFRDTGRRYASMDKRGSRRCCWEEMCLRAEDPVSASEQACTEGGGTWVEDCIYDPCEQVRW